MERKELKVSPSLGLNSDRQGTEQTDRRADQEDVGRENERPPCRERIGKKEARARSKERRTQVLTG